jgi:hypothetical protein
MSTNKKSNREDKEQMERLSEQKLLLIIKLAKSTGKLIQLCEHVDIYYKKELEK